MNIGLGEHICESGTRVPEGIIELGFGKLGPNRIEGFNGGWVADAELVWAYADDRSCTLPCR